MQRKLLTTVTTMALIFGAAQMAMAVEGGAPSERAGGMSSERMSPSGEANTNDQNKEGATRGMDRAQERMSEQGKTHEKATNKKVKGKKKHKDQDMNGDMNKDKGMNKN